MHVAQAPRSSQSKPGWNWIITSREISSRRWQCCERGCGWACCGAVCEMKYVAKNSKKADI